jgi:hypothetical protein
MTFLEELQTWQIAVERYDRESKLLVAPPPNGERKYKPQHIESILAAIEAGHKTRPDIAEATRIASATVWNYLMGMCDAGLVIRDGMIGQKRVFKRAEA